ncbi:hypothetical protein Tco_1007641, partial [Tanacetum coccineum]
PVEFRNEQLFVEPHVWIADPSFAKKAHDEGVQDLNSLVSSTLFNGEQTKAVSTECVDDVIRVRHGKDCLIPGRSFMRCVHKGEATAEECILGLAGNVNPFALTVASQDNRDVYAQKNTLPVAFFVEDT